MKLLCADNFSIKSYSIKNVDVFHNLPPFLDPQNTTPHGPHRQEQCYPRSHGAAACVEVGVGLEHVQHAIRCNQPQRQNGLLRFTTREDCEVPVSDGRCLVHVDAESEVAVAVVLAQMTLHAGSAQLLLASHLASSIFDGSPTILATIESRQHHRSSLAQLLLTFPLHMRLDLCCLRHLGPCLAQAEASQVPRAVALQCDFGFNLPWSRGEGLRSSSRRQGEHHAKAVEESHHRRSCCKTHRF